MSNRASLALIISALLIVFFSTPSFCGDTSNISVSNTAVEASQQPTPTNQTGKLAQQASDDRFDITTNDGIIYRKCKVVRVEPDGITFSHSKGVAKIGFPELPEEYSEAYGYDPEEADEYSLAAEKRQAEFAARQQKEDAQHGAKSQSQERESGTPFTDKQYWPWDTYNASFNLIIDDSAVVVVPGYGYYNWFYMNNYGRGMPWRPVRPPRPVVFPHDN